MKILPTDFDGQSIRRVFDEDTETWWFFLEGSEQPYEEIVQFKLWRQGM